MKEDLRVSIAAKFFLDIDKSHKHLMLREKARLAVNMTDVLFEELNREPQHFDGSVLSKNIKEISELSVRAVHCLRQIDIITVSDLVAHTKQDLLKVRNLGRVTVQEIESFLDKHGLYLGMYLKN